MALSARHVRAHDRNSSCLGQNQEVLLSFDSTVSFPTMTKDCCQRIDVPRPECPPGIAPERLSPARLLRNSKYRLIRTSLPTAGIFQPQGTLQSSIHKEISLSPQWILRSHEIYRTSNLSWSSTCCSRYWVVPQRPKAEY
jgi:hypothetical protein